MPETVTADPRTLAERQVAAPAIEAEGLKVHFRTSAGLVRAVDGVDLTVAKGAFHGIVGESGCGKTTLARAIVGLQSATAGRVRIAGRDRAEWQRADRKGFARAVQFIFQDPLGSMSRRQSVLQTLEEPLRIHGLGSAAERRQRVGELLDLVALPASVLDRLPRSLSGGQRQRVSIARALALDPQVLVCDEPLSALDVSVRAQIVNLFAGLQARLGLTIVIIAHDLAIVREFCSAVSVMYLGRIAEEGAARPLFADPAHPYSQALLSAVPSPDPRIEATRPRVLLEGDPPSPRSPPPGCRFSTRCSDARRGTGPADQPARPHPRRDRGAHPLGRLAPWPPHPARDRADAALGLLAHDGAQGGGAAGGPRPRPPQPAGRDGRRPPRACMPPCSTSRTSAPTPRRGGFPTCSAS